MQTPLICYFFYWVLSFSPYMCGDLKKPDWSRKKKFSCTCKMKKCLVFPLFFYFLNNFLKIIKNQQVKQFLQNKKHLIRYEELKPVQTQFFLFFDFSLVFSECHTYFTLRVCIFKSSNISRNIFSKILKELVEVFFFCIIGIH